MMRIHCLQPEKTTASHDQPVTELSISNEGVQYERDAVLGLESGDESTHDSQQLCMRKFVSSVPTFVLWFPLFLRLNQNGRPTG